MQSFNLSTKEVEFLIHQVYSARSLVESTSLHPPSDAEKIRWLKSLERKLSRRS